MFVCLCKKEFSQRQNYNRHTLECDTFMAANHVCACGKTCINSQELLKHKEACNKNATVPQQLECQLTQLIKKKPFRAKDGYYHIDGVKYSECFGTREEVISGIAYKTTGGLTKNKLLINKQGKVVSAVKFLQEKAYDRFGVFGVNKK